MIVVVPMAGRSRRFSERGVDTPKPFLDVGGAPMLARAFQTVAALPYDLAVFVALEEHVDRFGLEPLAERLAGRRARVVRIPDVTEGQLCTVLAAEEFIDAHAEIVIASADTYVESDLAADLARRRPDCRGLISVARLPGDHWSFARLGQDGWVDKVAEKERISPLASTGIYHFAEGREFVRTAKALVAAGETTRGEYYVIPLYQKYIAEGLRIGISEARAVWDMGNPDSLREFQAHLAAAQ